MHRKTLLALGIIGIVAVAAPPQVRRVLEDRRIARDGEQRALWIELTRLQLDCLERLQAALPQDVDMEKELARCQALAIDPATGEPVKAPEDRRQSR
jgi:hypothetical protein